MENKRSKRFFTYYQMKKLLHKLKKDKKDKDGRKIIKNLEKRVRINSIPHNFLNQLIWGIMWVTFIIIISLIFRFNHEIIVDYMSKHPIANEIMRLLSILVSAVLFLLYLSLGARSYKTWVPLGFIKGDVFILSVSFGLIGSWYLGRLEPFSNPILLKNDSAFLKIGILGVIYFLSVFIIGLMKEKEKLKKKYLYTGHSLDNPIEYPEDDLILREQFVRKMIRFLNRHDRDGYTIGLLGEWGSGKSSVFNLIQRYLPDESIIINFKPWYFGKDNHDVIQTFFSQLAKELQKQGKQTLKLNMELSAYAQLFSGIQVRQDSFIFSLQSIIERMIPTEGDSITESKEKIQQSLDRLDRPIYVFIDDLDRLDPHEVQMVLKLVRLVADFRNVTYLLALDEEIVVQSLQEMYRNIPKETAKVNARRYMEKFIQIPIYLPKTQQTKLGDVAWGMLEEILIDSNLEADIIKKDEFINYITRLNYNLRTIKRFLNCFELLVEILIKEVDSKDLLLLILIREANPNLYNFIYENSGYFLDEHMTLKDNERSKFAQLFPDYSKYTDILSQLLPLSQRLWDSQFQLKKNEIRNEGLGIRNSKVFNRYFQHGLPEREPSLQDVDALIASLNNAETYVELNSIYSSFLDRFIPDQANEWILFYIKKSNDIDLRKLLSAVNIRFEELYDASSDFYSAEQSSLIELTLELIRNFNDEGIVYFYKNTHIALVANVVHKKNVLLEEELIKVLEEGICDKSQRKHKRPLDFMHKDRVIIFNLMIKYEKESPLITDFFKEWVNSAEELNDFLQVSLPFFKNDFIDYSSEISLYVRGCSLLRLLPNNLREFLIPKSELPDRLGLFEGLCDRDKFHLEVFSFLYHHMIPYTEELLKEVVDNFKENKHSRNLNAQFAILINLIEKFRDKEEISKIRKLKKEIETTKLND